MVEKAINFEERFGEADTFTFTIVPDEELIASVKNDPRTLKDFVYKIIHRELFEKSQYVERLVLNFDISFPEYIQVSKGRPGKKGMYKHPRMHYHGTVFLKSVQVTPWFMLKLRRISSALGRLEVDTIDNLNSWTAYCEKYESVYPAFKKFKIDIQQRNKEYDFSSDSDSD